MKILSASLRVRAEAERERRRRSGTHPIHLHDDAYHIVSRKGQPRSFTLYAAQRDFVAADEQFTAFVGGIGSGKSFAGALRALRAAYGAVGTQRLPTPNLGIVTAPTYRMLEDATLRTFLALAGDRVKDFIKSEMKAVLDNGSEVLFRSVDDPEKLRGPNVSWWFGDEAAMYSPITWQIGIGRLREFGTGWAWLTTTPKGRNWLYKTFVQKPTDGYRVLRARTADNPYLDPAFVTALEQSYAGDFALQELEAEFLAFEGLIYTEWDPALHRYSHRMARDRFVRVAAGVDWGYSNPGVIIVGGVDSDGRLYVLHEEYRRQTLIEDWVQIAQQLAETYRIDTFYCDPAEPTNISRLVDAGLHAVKADNAVTDGIQTVKSRLVRRGDNLPRLLVQSECARLIAEFEQYQWAPSRDGTLRDQPLKANDHALDALRYLAQGVDVPLVDMTMGATRVL